MTARDLKKNFPSLASMRERYPVGTVVDVNGLKGTVSGYGLNSGTLIVMVGGERHKVPMPKKK